MSDGGFVISWSSRGQYQNFDIFAQQYDASSTPVNSEFRVNTVANLDQTVSSIATLSDGGYVITWRSHDNDQSGIYAQRYQSDGTALGDQFLVNKFPGESFYQPSIAALADGGFIIVYEAYEQDGSYADIYGQRFAANGTAVGDEFLVNNGSLQDGHQGQASISALEDGGFIVTWTSEREFDFE